MFGYLVFPFIGVVAPGAAYIAGWPVLPAVPRQQAWSAHTAHCGQEAALLPSKRIWKYHVYLPCF